MSTTWRLIATPVHDPGNILDLAPREILEAFDVKPRELTLLAGGPPCQPFSKASLWVEGSTPRMLDPRAATLRAFFNVLEAALPSAMLLENVRGMTFAPRLDRTREEAVDVLGAQLDAINERHGTKYTAQVLTIDAADYGVPQRRERVFIFASREGQTLDLPAPTHAATPNAHQDRLATCWDAIGDLDSEPDDEYLTHGSLGPTTRQRAGGQELPMAYPTRRGRASVRLAHSILELLAEAGEEQAVMDASSSAWAGHGPVSLAKSQAQRSRDGSAADNPRLARDFGVISLGSASARQRGTGGYW